jgi:hypothetical protein
MGQYPSDIVLKEIKNFDIAQRDIDELIDLIENEWEFSECGFNYKRKYDGFRTLELHTFGWSGNEDIILALKQNFGFWSCFWRKSEAGGHYYFRVKDIRKDMEGYKNG